MAEPIPVCFPPPPGVCPVVCPPGCICVAVTWNCGPKHPPQPVPTLDLVPMGVLMALVVLLALLMSRAGRSK